MSKIEIAPSILSADAAFLAEEIKRVENADISYLHIDIMDGHFVPNLSYSPMIVKAIRPYSKLIFDVHLMLSEPMRYAEEFVHAGADLITVHAEAVDDMKKTAEILHSYGVKAGISVKPNTPADVLLDVISEYDLVLVMSVEPGFGGQKYMDIATDKIALLKQYISDKKLSTLIEVDGGINIQNAAVPAAAGADILVAGSAVFGAADPAEAILNMKKATEKAVE